MQFNGLLSSSTISATSCHLDNEKDIYPHSRNTVIGWVFLMLCLKRPSHLRKRKRITISAGWDLLDGVFTARKSVVHQNWNWCEHVLVALSRGWICLAHPGPAKTLKFLAVCQGYKSATGDTELLLSWRSQRKYNKYIIYYIKKKKTKQKNITNASSIA